MPLSSAVAIKSETETTYTVAGWACVFDTPDDDGADLVGDYFDARSDLWLDKLGATGKPVLYDHGSNKALGKRVIGRATLDPKDDGVWFEAEVEKATTYANQIRALIDAGLMGASIGSVGHLVEREPVATGKSWLKAFPAFELSLTVHPAEPRTLSVEAVKALTDLELLSEAEVPAPAPANNRHQLKAASFEEIQDRIRTLLNPMCSSPVCEPDFTYIVETYPDHVIVRREDCDGDGDGGFWRIAYTQAADDTVSLGEAVQVEQTYTPRTKSAPTSAAADTQLEALEPAAQESPAVDEETTTTPETKSALETKIDQVLAALNNEPATKSAGFAVPGIITSRDQTVDEASAFKAFLSGKPLSPAMKAALNEATAAQGGYAVPVQYSQELVTPLAYSSFLRKAGARVLQFQGTDAVHIPSLTYAAAAVRTAEANAYDEKEATLGETVFTPIKYTRLSKASEELVADSRFDLWGQILMPDYVQAFAAAENGTSTSGFTGATAVAGTSPQGVVTGSTTGVTSASATAITGDEVISTYFALSPLYRGSATWMMNDATLGAIRALKASGSGEYLVQFGLDGSPAATLLGRPIVVNNSMDTIAATKDVVVFADFSYYWIGEWPGLDVQRLSELYAANGQVGFRAFRRWDAHVMLAAAFTKLTCHA